MAMRPPWKKKLVVCSSRSRTSRTEAWMVQKEDEEAW
jgi:hypothetical protein